MAYIQPNKNASTSGIKQTVSTEEEEVYDMTPNVSEEEAKKVRDKFDRTYMKGSDPENLPEWTPQGSTVGPDPITKKASGVKQITDEQLVAGHGAAHSDHFSKMSAIKKVGHKDSSGIKQSSPVKWVQAVAALAPMVMGAVNQKKQEREAEG